MKIIHEESVYLIPEDNNIVVLAGAKQKDIIDCFTNQFVKKKRNYCKVLDSENQLIKPTELNFVYYPYGSDINSILKQLILYKKMKKTLNHLN